MAIQRGKLVRWIDDKGFGFIKPEDGGSDIFIHISALKDMSRKPIVGDIIQFQLGSDANGKIRAVNAKIEGVSQVLALFPFEQKYKKNFSTPAKKISNRKTGKTSISQKRFNLLPTLIAIVIAAFIYSKVSKVKILFDQAEMPKVEAQQEKPPKQFQCQGKVWCSEMSSYEEAVFYLRHCPDTKMDGDSDGIPCEQQFQ